MDLNFTRLLTRRYLAPVLVVLFLSSGIVVYFANEYKDLGKQKDALSEKIKLFSDESLRHERQRMEDERALLARKAELDKREFLLLQADKENSRNLSEIQERNAQQKIAEASLQKTADLVSQSHRDKLAEERLLKAISEFSVLGVDITDEPPCDQEGRKQYAAAKAKYSEARALAIASNLYNRYARFFLDHETMVIHFSDCKNHKEEEK